MSVQRPVVQLIAQLTAKRSLAAHHVISAGQQYIMICQFIVIKKKTLFRILRERMLLFFGILVLNDGHANEKQHAVAEEYSVKRTVAGRSEEKLSGAKSRCCFK
jgi:hypothetical protein